MELPKHLQRYIVSQDDIEYTAEDQAVWRFIMRELTSTLKQSAHPLYLTGLKKTGITLDKIPQISEISRHLLPFGWQAVPVSGFIPPAAFMELQSLGFLPIATALRSLDHFDYTPAPDIVHEAAGHAPFLIEPVYAAYLKEYAAVARKAIVSKHDLEQYECIRKLSDLKEDPHANPLEIDQANRELEIINQKITNVSEAGWLSRMNWWTAEYGLIGSLQDPKIYGAGLLSSIGESRSCLHSSVKKIPLSVDCINQPYDITEPQPQLFVTPDFEYLSEVLGQLKSRMAFEIGGIEGLGRAQGAQSVTTCQLENGVQISGELELFEQFEGQPCFIKYKGPVQICIDNNEIIGQGPKRHPDGFSSPIGSIKDFESGISQASAEKMKNSKDVKLNYSSGIQLTGKLQTYYANSSGEVVLLSFESCLIVYGDKTLYDPSWGPCDLVVGRTVNSVFGGPADRLKFGETFDFVNKKVPRPNFSQTEIQRQALFAELQHMKSRHDLQSQRRLEQILKMCQGTTKLDQLLRFEAEQIMHLVLNEKS